MRFILSVCLLLIFRKLSCFISPLCIMLLCGSSYPFVVAVCDVRHVYSQNQYHFLLSLF